MTPLDTPCIEWTGARDRQNYGITYLDGKVLKASRAAWIKKYGPIPPDKPCVLHRCDNPPCYNTDHLFLGTRGDNNRDAAAKGRSRNGYRGVTHCKRGHEFTPENTYRRPNGGRVCRTCKRSRYVPRPVTHCKQGHQFAPENTYTYPDGKRACRECMRRWLRERRARKGGARVE